MKKSLLALAAMGAFAGAAQAQSSVTVYGILDVGYNNMKTDLTNSSGVTTSSAITSTGKTNNYTTSRLGFRGTEDLGKGLRAGFNIELGMFQNDAANANGAAAGGNAASPTLTSVTSNYGNAASPFVLRLSNVSLGGGFGTITLGRQTTAVENAWGAGDVGGANNFIGRAYTVGLSQPAAATGALVGSDRSIGKQNNDRSDRLVTYTTPNMSGFTATVQYGDGQNEAYTGTTNTNNNKQTEIGAALSYTAGPAQVTLGYLSAKSTLNSANVENGQPIQLVLGANYDFKVAKAFVSVSQGSNKTQADVKKDARNIYELGVSVPVGALVLNASVLTGNYTPVEGAAEGKLSGMQVGALYNLSKRTMAYGVYGQDKLSDVTEASKNKGFSRSNFGVGVRHTF
jgi:predicted porin